MNEEFLGYFVAEGHELTQAATDDLLALEQSPDDSERIDGAFRALHTLKGSVGLFDLAPLGALLHEAETLLGAFRERRLRPARPAVDALLGCVAATEGWLDGIGQTGRLPEGAETTCGRLEAAIRRQLGGVGGPAPPAPDEVVLADAAPPDPSARLLRVEAEKIDALADLVGELIIAKNRLAYLGASAALPADFLRALAASQAEIERLTGEMQRGVTRLRAVPLNQIFGRLKLVVRETAGRLGKSVRLEMAGGQTEADKSVVDGLHEPLLHMLRNALDHGMERPEARRAAGKPEMGILRVMAWREGPRIALSVSDDGQGIDPSRVRARAIEKGFLAESAAASLDDESVLDLIFAPGFSTAGTVTDISGRGVGLDVVRRAIEVFGGSVTVASTPGKGTVFSLKMPLAVAVTAIFVVRAGDDVFGVKFEDVVETLRLRRDEIQAVGTKNAFVRRDHTVPLLCLAEVLGVKAGERGADAKVLVIEGEGGGGLMGLEVDGFGERLDVVLRPLTGLLAGLRGAAGTALLGDGRVLVVLDLGRKSLLF
jgi:two-component system chemotaxis sensor kinase CheA